MRVFEVAMVALFAALGVRSLVHWARRPFDSRDPRDHVLFSLFVTGRVGLWFALSGLFLLYSFSSAQGRAFVDDVREYAWFAMVFLALAGIQLVAGFFLGRRSTP